jgi:hypothetical protein
MPRFARLVLLLLLALSLDSSPLFAWGCKGHQTVALLARKHLTPEARQFALALLAQVPIDPQLKRHCGDGVDDLLADASTWPDDVRADRKNGHWHYIDIPRAAARQPLEGFCPPESCVTQAIVDQMAILKNKSADPRRRAEALRYIIHFVGDLHMPLHASTNNDEGGNCTPVRFFRRRPRARNNSYEPNLHFLWDTAILERDMRSAEPAEYAELLDQTFSTEEAAWQGAGIHIDDWAWESHDLAESVVYSRLLPPAPTEVPAPVHSCTDANHIGERMLRMNFFAGQAYQDLAAPLVQKRIAQAGIRLALLLNDAAL